jgi:hypothetical protein
MRWRGVAVGRGGDALFDGEGAVALAGVDDGRTGESGLA